MTIPPFSGKISLEEFPCISPIASCVVAVVGDSSFLTFPTHPPNSSPGNRPHPVPRHSIILFRFCPPAESAPGFPDPPPWLPTPAWNTFRNPPDSPASLSTSFPGCDLSIALRTGKCHRKRGAQQKRDAEASRFRLSENPFGLFRQEFAACCAQVLFFAGKQNPHLQSDRYLRPGTRPGRR